MYDMETYERTFSECIGGDNNQYIKIDEIKQNVAGTKYAITYFDDGVFKIRNFEK